MFWIYVHTRAKVWYEIINVLFHSTLEIIVAGQCMNSKQSGLSFTNKSIQNQDLYVTPQIGICDNYLVDNCNITT